MRYLFRPVGRAAACLRRPYVRPLGLCSRFHTSAIRQIDFDPYKTLGIDKSASQADIKKAYYQLVKKYHPDVNKEKDAEKRFHKIQESYELLSDKDKRTQYDQFGASAFDANGNANPYAGGNPFGGNPFGGNPYGGSAGGNPFGGMGFDFEDLFRDAFAGGNARGSARFKTEHYGDDIEIFKSINFNDSIFGTAVKVNYKAVDSCHTCSGSGLKQGKNKATCPTCHGTGHTTHVIGGFHMASTCNTCGGSGVTVKKSDQCNTCHGSGVEEVPKSTEINIPPGINDGSRLRVPSMGDAPLVPKDKFTTIKKGDLIINVKVEKDPKFRRVKNKIIYDHEIMMTTAALGGEVIIPTVDGENLKLKVRSGTQNGRKLIIPQKGAPINRNLNNRDDMEVVLNVKTLVPETPMQVALLEALADTFKDANAKRTETVDNPVFDEKDADASAESNHVSSSAFKKISNLLNKFFHHDDKKKPSSNE